MLFRNTVCVVHLCHCEDVIMKVNSTLSEVNCFRRAFVFSDSCTYPNSRGIINSFSSITLFLFPKPVRRQSSAIIFTAQPVTGNHTYTVAAEVREDTTGHLGKRKCNYMTATVKLPQLIASKNIFLNYIFSGNECLNIFLKNIKNLL